MLADPTTTYTWAQTGTHTYWAPELFANENASFKTDLYALGCTVFEALTGKPPFVGADLKAAHTNDLHVLPAINDPALLRVICMLLAKNPANRPTDVRRIRDMLAPASHLAPAQRTLQVVAARVAARKGRHEALSRNAARFEQMQTIARVEFSEIWGEVGEHARVIDADAKVFHQGDNCFLECLESRLSAELVRQPFKSSALWLGQIVVRALDEPTVSLVANVDCVATGDNPAWRQLGFSANYIWTGQRPDLGTRMGEGSVGINTTALALVYNDLWPTPGQMHVAPLCVTQSKLTAAGLFETFSQELDAMIQ